MPSKENWAMAGKSYIDKYLMMCERMEAERAGATAVTTTIVTVLIYSWLGIRQKGALHLTQKKGGRGHDPIDRGRVFDQVSLNPSLPISTPQPKCKQTREKKCAIQY